MTEPSSDYRPPGPVPPSERLALVATFITPCAYFAATRRISVLVPYIGLFDALAIAAGFLGLLVYVVWNRLLRQKLLLGVSSFLSGWLMVYATLMQTMGQWRPS